MQGVGSEEIRVARLRQIHHLPLVWKGDLASCPYYDEQSCRALTSDGDWMPVTESIDLLDDAESETRHVLAEQLYYHDFVRDFLHISDGKGEYKLFRRELQGVGAGKAGLSLIFLGVGQVEFQVEFEIARQTLHVFNAGIAILTVETIASRKSGLTLAHTQTIIDDMRRLFPPFFDRTNRQQRVPVAVRLPGTDNLVIAAETPAGMLGHIKVRGPKEFDAPLQPHWAHFLRGVSAEHWRIPSDERVPTMSYIALEQNGSARDTLGQIRESDWYRLAEVDDPGEGFFYNPDFLRSELSDVFYDRFFPHKDMPDYVATRHVFGGAHYALVTMDGSFAQDNLEQHFRRHYAQMGMIVQFEMATLLSFSRRITEIVRPMDTCHYGKKDRARFRRAFLTIQQRFLEFTHRYRFTGVSAQIQPGEMYARWRRSQGLDNLYADVRQEISTAVEFAISVDENEQTHTSTDLTWVGILLAAVLAPATLIQLKAMDWVFFGWLGHTDDDVMQWVEFVHHALVFGLLVGLVLLFVGGWRMIRRWLEEGD